MILHTSQSDEKSELLSYHFHFSNRAILDSVSHLQFSLVARLSNRLTNRHWSKNQPWNCKLKTNLTPVFSVISPSRWPKTSKCTCFSIMERNPTVAISVAIHASVLLIWKDTYWFIVERSLLVACSVTTPAHKLVPSKNTWQPIQEKLISVAHSVFKILKHKRW